MVSDGVVNTLREDCDILVVGEIRYRETMEAIIEIMESNRNDAYEILR